MPSRLFEISLNVQYSLILSSGGLIVEFTVIFCKNVDLADHQKSEDMSFCDKKK